MKIFKTGHSDIGIDLGTANILATTSKGIIYREPSVVAIKNDTEEVVAFGREAKEMLGRTPKEIRAVRPLKDGVIADFTATKLMLSSIIRKITKSLGIMKPRIVIGVPAGITEVEERAVEEAALSCGARDVYLIEEPMAAAIGAGLDVEDAMGNMIVDIGGGTTEVAVISLGGIVTSTSIKIAGDEMTDDIVKYSKEKLCIVIGENAAETVKMSIGCATPLVTELTETVGGRDVKSGLPIKKEITSKDAREAMESTILNIIDGIKQTLENTPPELSSDIVVNGITLAGGGALIKGIDKLIAEKTGIAVKVTDNPLDAVANGTMKVLENVNYLNNMVSSRQSRK